MEIDRNTKEDLGVRRVVNWSYFPRYNRIPNHLGQVVDIFKSHYNEIKSPDRKLKSDDVLAVIRKDLEDINFKVEKGKKKVDKIMVPVLFGSNGKLKKAFDADAYNPGEKTVFEVEAGRGYVNHQFLKDLFQACMMHDVDYLGIAVRNYYKNHRDYEKVEAFFDTLYTSGRLQLPLQGILIVGY